MSGPRSQASSRSLLERDDVHGHVVLAEREVVERLAVHVDHEGVADLLGGLAGVVLQHPGRVDGDVARRAAHDVEDRRRRRRDRPGHLDAVRQEHGVGHEWLLGGSGGCASSLTRAAVSSRLQGARGRRSYRPPSASSRPSSAHRRDPERFVEHPADSRDRRSGECRNPRCSSAARRGVEGISYEVRCVVLDGGARCRGDRGTAAGRTASCSRTPSGTSTSRLVRTSWTDVLQPQPEVDTVERSTAARHRARRRRRGCPHARGRHASSTLRWHRARGPGAPLRSDRPCSGSSSTRCRATLPSTITVAPPASCTAPRLIEDQRRHERCLVSFMLATSAETHRLRGCVVVEEQHDGVARAHPRIRHSFAPARCGRTSVREPRTGACLHPADASPSGWRLVHPDEVERRGVAGDQCREHVARTAVLLDTRPRS